MIHATHSGPGFVVFERCPLLSSVPLGSSMSETNVIQMITVVR